MSRIEILLLLFCLVAVAQEWTNMNGAYKIANPNVFSPIPFSTDYNTKNVEYFEIYSAPIRTRYGEVYWTVQDTLPLPEEIVQRFDKKSIAIIGVEEDQVFKTENGDVSVPAYWSYSHHWTIWLLGNGSTLGFQPDNVYPQMDNAMSHGSSRGYWKVNSESSDESIPQSLRWSQGAEYRKTYQGMPEGYVQPVYSPQTYVVEPMQIDTHNRDYNGPGFRAGIEPKSSLAPPNSSYSGLIECPCTTRFNKRWGITYKTQFSGRCSTPAQNASECFDAIRSLGLSLTEQRIISDSSVTYGCHMIGSESNQAIGIFNSFNSLTPVCRYSSSVYGQSQALIKLQLLLDNTVANGLATITISGPSNKWFGVGFNADSMGDRPYTIIVDGAGVVTERRLGDHVPGSLLTPMQSRVISNTVVGDIRTVVLNRAFAGLNSGYYSFDGNSSTINFINAIGFGPDFSFHQMKGTGSLHLSIPGQPVCVCNDGLHGWINDIKFSKNCLPQPTGDLLALKNPTCTIQTYSGGIECCRHQTILLDTDQVVDPRYDEIYLKFRFYYQEYEPTYHRIIKYLYWQTEAKAEEYDIEPCAPGTSPADCVYIITSRFQAYQALTCDHTKIGCIFPDKGVQFIYLSGHCHAPSCISLELYNADTGQLICKQYPYYGNGQPGPFNEPGYLNTPPCLWGNEDGLQVPPVIHANTNLLSIKKNNNTVGHYADMAQWLIMFAPLK